MRMVANQPPEKEVQSITQMADYARRLHDEKIAEQGRLDQRANSVITSSGVLVTAIGAVSAFAFKGGTLSSPPPKILVALLFASLTAFLLSALLAQWSITISSRRSFVNLLNLAESSSDEESIRYVASILFRTARTDLTIGEDLQRNNHRRAGYINLSILMQTVAVSILALAVALSLFLWR